MRFRLLLVVLLALLVPSSAAWAVPVPDQDPFYAQPPGLAGAQPGQVLASRAITATAYSLPLPVKAWQIKYRSVDNSGTPTANVTTLLIPKTPWLGKGKRPLLSYQVAEDSAGTQCAPSYGLRAGLPSGEPVAETGLIAASLSRNWAVVVPDYQGPDSQFLGAQAEARGVLDSLKAVRAFTTAGLKDAPIGLVGYSGGAVASTFAAQAQGDYAPELPIKGVAMGGVVADFRPTIKAFDGFGLDGVVMMGVATVSRAYPAEHLTQYLNAKGQAVLKQVERACAVNAQIAYPFGGLDALTTTPKLLDDPGIAAFLHRISPLGVGGVPIAPVYEYHATFDELAPVGPARELLKAFCAGGATVKRTETPLGEHGSEAIAGFPGALAYLGDRFAGKPAPSNC